MYTSPLQKRVLSIINLGERYGYKVLWEGIQFFFFGGSRVLRYAAVKLKLQGLPVFVITSKRLIGETVDGNSFKEFLEKNELPYEVIYNVNKSQLLKKNFDKDAIGISFGAPWIFNKKFIGKFNGKLLNMHSRNLPQNRGSGGFSWMILNSDRKSSNLIHMIDAGIDTGPIVDKKDFTFPNKCMIPVDYDL
jgi:hypothetical protein